MDVTLTIVATAPPTAADLRVGAPDASPAAPVLDALRAVVGAAADDGLSIAGRPVASDGSAADCGLADGVVVHVGNAPPPTSLAMSDLVVSSGPDAGRRLALTDGEHVVGRAHDSALRINDSSVSRAHLVASVRPGEITVTDVDSANGTTIDGGWLLTWCQTPVSTGETLRLGDSELRLVAGTSPADRTSGPTVIHRAPRMLAPAPSVDVTFPEPPVPPVPTRVPLLAAVAPLVAGVVLAVVLHQWQFLAFTALSPIMILGQAAGDRRSARKTSRRARREHTEATATARQRLVQALDDERHRRYAQAPDLATLTGAVHRRTDVLWQRSVGDPDALTVRLGRGDLPSTVNVVGGPGSATILDVPVCVGLAQVGVLGVCGPRDLTTALIRSLIVQATALHSPEDLRLVVLAPSGSEDWAWVRWLPHVGARDGEGCTALVGFDDEQVSARVGELAARGASSSQARPHTLVLVDGTSATRGLPSLTALTEPATMGLSFVFCAENRRDLPAATRAVVTLSATPRPRLQLTTHDQGDICDVVPDLVAGDVATTTARALAPLRAGAGSNLGTLPRSLRWEQAAGVDLADPGRAAAALIRNWSRGASTTITLGAGRDGDVTIDLCRDGPHALIAGTTGSGKSELLLSLVASLAARNRPDQLSLLLIDHKGGAAFGPCAALPHTVGVVTDLDADSTRRALLSLSAEIRRREALLAAVAATDIDSYHAALTTGGLSAEPLARLVIVVDEFATLAEEQPELVGGLVGIAQRGRSLGVHLVLATQRPDGVVSADIRANTRLRICLGVARENESRDVIDGPDAVSISRTTPGRGYLRIGPGDLREFQAAQIGGPRADRPDVAVTISPAATLGSLPAAAPKGQTAAADLEVLIAAAIDVSAALECTPPPPPWLLPLPERLALSALSADSDPELISWGLVDLPALGVQRPLQLDLRVGGTTLIAGSARSGRSTAVRAIALSAAARRRPDQLHLWAVDAGAGLSDLAELAHCGAIVPAHDRVRVERLLRHLTDEVARRRLKPEVDRPALLLLIDSWEGLIAAGDDRDGGRVTDPLLRLAADGPAADLHTVITSDRGGLVGRLGGAAADKIVLRLADPGDFALIGLPARDVPRHLPAGRGVRAGDLGLTQVARPDAAIVAAANRWAPAQRAARRFDPLPVRVALADVRSDPGPGTDEIAWGLDADDLTAVTTARPDVGSSFVIVGPPGSGRSTALVLLARQLTGRPLAVSCLRRSSLLDQVEAIDLPRDDQEHAATLLDSLCRGSAPPDVLIDDIDLLAEGPLWARLEELIRNPAGADQVIACTGTVEAVSAAFRGPIAQARRAKVGLLLCPSRPHDAELFGILLPRRFTVDDPPGRGWLARRGTATELQLADPGDRPVAGTGPRAQPSTVLELSGLGTRSRE